MKQGDIVMYQFFVNGECVFPIIPPLPFKLLFYEMIFKPVCYWRIKIP